MFAVLSYLAAAVGGYVVGHYGLPVVAGWFKSWAAVRSVAAAKKLLADQAAQAKAIDDAKALLAAQPAPVTPPTPPVSG